MNQSIVIREIVRSAEKKFDKKLLKDFIDLPWKIYQNDPHWVPPLKIAVKDLLDTKKHPFYQHAEIKLWNAYLNDVCVGRIAAVIDQDHNRVHNEKTGFFGFFECIDNQSVAHALLKTAKDWCQAQQMNTLRGPMNPSTNYECGLLVKGFEDSPFVMMTHNPPYYETLIQSFGMSKAMDLFSYILDSNVSKFSERLIAHGERAKKNDNITIRIADMKNFDQEVETILDIYNDAWEHNWGFVPMRPEEFKHLAKDMKMIVDPNLLLMVSVRGEPAGFGLALPDVHQAQKKVTSGELFPTGILKLLWNLKGPGRKKTINRCRVITLGIKKKFRELGLGPLMYTEYLKRGPASGYPVGEASWILENNIPMNKALKMMCGEVSKVYRIYDLKI